MYFGRLRSQAAHAVAQTRPHVPYQRAWQATLPDVGCTLHQPRAALNQSAALTSTTHPREHPVCPGAPHMRWKDSLEFRGRVSLPCIPSIKAHSLKLFAQARPECPKNYQNGPGRDSSLCMFRLAILAASKGFIANSPQHVQMDHEFSLSLSESSQETRRLHAIIVCKVSR